MHRVILLLIVLDIATLILIVDIVKDLAAHTRIPLI